MDNETREVFLFINKSCKLKSNNRDFPGYQPVSLGLSNLSSLHGFLYKSLLEYFISYKADGQRAYLGFKRFGDKNKCFILFRSGKLVFIKLSVSESVYNGTLFDIEILENDHLMLFDCIIINGKTCKYECYPTRIEIIKRFLELQLSFMSLNIVKYMVCNETRENKIMITETFKLSCKLIFKANMVKYLGKHWWHEHDGFIWTLSNSDPIQNSIRKNIFPVLKWKPPEKITIDFKVICSPTNMPEIELKETSILLKYQKFICKYKTVKLIVMDNHKEMYFSSMNDVECENGKIYECRWVKNEWLPLKVRSDKLIPNSKKTAIHTIQNIIDNISLFDIQSIYD